MTDRCSRLRNGALPARQRKTVPDSANPYGVHWHPCLLCAECDEQVPAAKDLITS